MGVNVLTMKRNGALILCYHRVAESAEDPFFSVYALTISPLTSRRYPELENRRRSPMHFFRRVDREWS